MSTRRARVLEYALLIALSIAAVFRWLHLIEHIRKYYVDLPTWDYWRVVQNLAAYRAGNLRVLWLQHNEHRIIFPELVFAADMLWFHGRKILPTVVSLACYFATLLLLAGSLLRDVELRTSSKLAAFFLASITLGWMGSAIVIGDPFLLQWTMLHFWIVCALLLLSMAARHANYSLLTGAIVCASAATYTSGNGMLIWPVLLTAGVLLRLRRLGILAVAVAAIATVAIYFIGYRPMGHVSFGSVAGHLPHSLGFIGSYLGMPFAADRSRSFGVMAGWCNILLFGFLFWTAARKGLLRARPTIVLFGLFAFTLLSATIAAAGRMDPADRSFVLAKQARYVTTPLVNWAALVLFCIWLGSRGGKTLWSTWRVPLAVAVTLLLGFRHLSGWVQARDAEVADLQLGALGVQAGVLDDAVLKKIFPDPAFVRSFLPELRASHLSIYSEGQTNWVGEPLSTVARKFLPARPASLRFEAALPSANELGMMVPEARPNDWLVFVDPTQVIVGLGRILPAGIPFTVRTQMQGGGAMFGFVKSRAPVSSLQVYVVATRFGR